MKKIIGITGGSGSGKGALSDLLKGKGALILDADKIYKALIKPNMPLLLEIEKTFGKEVIMENGELNRKALAKIVFNDECELHKLDAITHKYIIAEMENCIKACKETLIVIDAPTLFESGLNSICDKTIGVLADKNIRIERIKMRDCLSEDEAKMRIFAQKEDEFYIENCDFTVNNNGSIEELKLTAKELIKEVSGEEN